MTIRWPSAWARAGRSLGAPFERFWRRFLRRPVLAVRGVFPLTRTGLAFTVMFGLSIWFYGLLSRDLVLLVGGLGGLLVVAAFLLCTLLAAGTVFLRTRQAATPGELDLDTGIPQPTGYSLRRTRWIPFIVTSWEWVDDGGGETAARVELEATGRRLVELASPARRGIVTRIVRRFAVRDLFGLTEISWRRIEIASLRVLPYRGMLSQMPPPAGMAEGDDLEDPFAEPKGDRVEMRQYAPGDPLRMVLWKVYARSGKLMVRTPERSVAERKRGCAYLVTGQSDDATAAVARVTIERGLLGEDWCFAADGVDREAREDREAALEIIARSGAAKAADRAARLGAFLTRCENEGYQFCYLFIPPEDAAWDAVAGQAAAATTLRVQVLTGASELLDADAPATTVTARLSRWLIAERPSDGVTLEEIRARAARLAGMAADLVVAERSTGRTVNDMLGYRG